MAGDASDDVLLTLESIIESEDFKKCASCGESNVRVYRLVGDDTHWEACAVCMMDWLVQETVVVRRNNLP